jgi:hypothetical protein
MTKLKAEANEIGLNRLNKVATRVPRLVS